MANTHFDYESARKQCEAAGFVWQVDGDLYEFDSVAYEMKLTQAQVNYVMAQHIKRVKKMFNPQTYSRLQRVALAMFFLFGKKPNADTH